MSDQPAKRGHSLLHRVTAAACIVLVCAILVIGGYSYIRSLHDVRSAESSVQITQTTTAETTTETTTTSRYPLAAARTTETVTLGSDAPVLAHNAALIEVTPQGNTLIAERAADAVIYPASMTKIMTLVTFLERFGTDRLDEITEMSEEVLQTAHFNAASCAGFYPGELCTVRDLLYGLILPSGADAALTLANLASGSEEAFVQEMNRLAAEMGLEKTHFVNCTGLHDEQHVSSVQDIARILCYALQNPVGAEILSAPEHTTASTYQHGAGIKLKSTVFTRLAAAVLPEGAKTLAVCGGKTGYTDEAGQCLATYADTPAGKRYLCVVAGCAPKIPMEAIYDTLTLYQLADRPLDQIARLVPPEPETTDLTTTDALLE